MIKRIFVIAFTGAAITLNTTTTVIMGSVALATIKKVAVVVDELSAERAATARARVSSLQHLTHAEQPHDEISKTRSLVGQATPYHRMIVPLTGGLSHAAGRTRSSAWHLLPAASSASANSEN